MTAPAALMAAWLQRQLPAEASDWLLTWRGRLRAGGVTERDFNLAISLAPRRLGKADLALGPEDLAAADAARRGWDPQGWTVDQAGRLVLLLAETARPVRPSPRASGACSPPPTCPRPSASCGACRSTPIPRCT